MIKEVIYYQAQCDLCGKVDEGGEYSAWHEQSHAVEKATMSYWRLLEVDLPNAFKRLFENRVFLICNNHDGHGIAWCATCDDNLDETKWALAIDGLCIVTTCPNQHSNRIMLHVPESGGSENG